MPINTISNAQYSVLRLYQIQGRKVNAALCLLDSHFEINKVSEIVHFRAISFKNNLEMPINSLSAC